MAEETYDVIIIGSGPGGYVCAFRAAQLGLKTAIVEKDPYLGGTCLNVGCIPSKALLHSTELYHQVAHGESHGIAVSDLKMELSKLMERKNVAVDRLRKGVQSLMDKREITVLKGKGKLLGDRKVEVSSPDEKLVIEADNIVIATGSVPVELSALKFDGKKIVSSEQAIAFEEIPEKLVVVGGGAIGLELGSVWSRIGSEVTVVEFLPTIAAGSDEDVSKLAERIFKKQGLKIQTDTKVTGVEEKDGRLVVKAERKNKELEFEADRILVSVGRKPFTDGLGLENVGVETDDKGRIKVENFETAADGIWAIGDVIPGPMLAHKAEEDGVAVAELIAGKAGHVDYSLVPNVIYTDPEIATVGMTERAAKEAGHEIKVGKFSLQASGRAIAQDATDGMVKVIADAETDRVLGVAVIASGASEIIASAVAHMTYGASAEDIGRTVHAHPTISEAVKEAALAVHKAALHSL